MKKYLLFFSLCMQNNSGTELTVAQKKAIGMQIWQNEAGKKYEQLVFWKQNEAFPSLGIGHFIWYPTGHTDIYTQTFPNLLIYFKQKKVNLPSWLATAEGAPWKNYQEFMLHAHDAQTEELRKLLFDTMDLQLDFIVQRLDAAWKNIQKHVSRAKRKAVNRHFQALRQTPAGMYALIDYLNFKGEGTNPTERYRNKGWGLLQVLEAIPDYPQTPIVAAFAEAATNILKERVSNAPAHKSHEQQWLIGWHNRINTYRTFTSA